VAAREQDVLRTNAYAADWIAGTVLVQLRDYCAAVERTEKEHRGTLQNIARASGGRAASEAFCRELFDRFNDPAFGLRRAGDAKLAFDSVFVQGADGLTRGRWPAPPEPDVYYALRFDGRDYFRGAARLAQAGSSSAYVSAAFKSKADAMYKIGISRPIVGEDGRTLLGVLVATVATDPAFGTRDLSDRPRLASLAAPLEYEIDVRPSARYPGPRHIMLLHEGLAHGQFVRINNPRVDAFVTDPSADPLQLPRRSSSPVLDANYQDPVGGEFAGRWLAAFAPVGNTHLVVIVQTRVDDAIALDRIAARRLAWLGASAVVVVATLLGLALWAAGRRNVATRHR
jgi:hypothetical protein